jgi:undecaprenyl-diphosphatase
MWKSSSVPASRHSFLPKDPDVLVATAAIGLCVFSFVVIASEIDGAPGYAFDAAILIAVRSAATSWLPAPLESIMRDLTGLGSNLVIYTTILIVSLYLLLMREWRAVLALMATVTPGIVLCDVLKLWFMRPRPNIVSPGQPVYSMSFPSSHAMLSTLVFLTQATLLTAKCKRRSIKVSVATTMAILIGFSRIYLGVHWPTDVLAGWAAGLALALTEWLIFSRTAPQHPRHPASIQHSQQHGRSS